MLLTEVLRDQYKMPGFVRSDMTAVSRLWGSHYTAPDKPDAIRQGMEAGVDLQLYDFTHEEWAEGIRFLITSGKMAEEVLDNACRRVLKLKFALGLFENPYVDESLYEQTANCREHQETALEIARKSICLLKNEKKLLPLSEEFQTIAVVGPGADEPALGDYCVNFEPSHMVTVLDGIKSMAGKERTVLYEKGCSYLGERIIPFHNGWFRDEEGNHGLTYTNFSYSNLQIEGNGLAAAEIEDGASVKVSFTVTNTGQCFGEETAQLYLRDMVSCTVKPEKELAGFKKIALGSGESSRIELMIGKRQMRTLNAKYEWHVEPGTFKVMIGDNAANVLLEGNFDIF